LVAFAFLFDLTTGFVKESIYVNLNDYAMSLDPSASTLEKGTVSKLKEGDMQAFDRVYRHYAQKLFQFSLSLLKNRADAEEIVQETFLKLWANRHKIDLYASFQSYLFTIAYNTMMSVLRKRVSEQKYVDYVKSLNLIERETSVAGKVEFEEFNDQVRNIIEQLPPRQREVFRLSREQGLSYQEIAQQLGLSVNTIENHMTRALKFIKSKLAEHSLACLLLFYLIY
jgi:RNA polymerase sigma-70 factor (ECF subfamily)